MIDKVAVRLYMDPGLHKPCDPIKDIDDDIFELVSKMLICMKINYGVGLSANQVGVQKQLCVVSLENNTKQMAMINPKITHVSKKDRKKLSEGCLSAPRVFVPKKRYKEIVVECLNLQGDKQIFHLTNLDARILQHEIDHLNGITIIDNLATFKK